MALQPFRPMPLVRFPQPFDHPDWLFEVKHDGFRALAHITGHHCALRSSNGHTFKHWPQLCEELAHAIKAHDAVIDGEIVCPRSERAEQLTCCCGATGRNSIPSTCWPVDGEDLRDWPLMERKRRLRQLIPSVPTRLLCVDHIKDRGRDFFEVACAHDLEGIVAKPANGRYHSDATSTNWVKLKNPQYTQMTARHELFASRRGAKLTRRKGPPLAL